MSFSISRFSSATISSSLARTNWPLLTSSYRGMPSLMVSVRTRIKSAFISFNTLAVSVACSRHIFLPPSPSSTYSESDMPDSTIFLPPAMWSAAVTPLSMYASRGS
ncbi:hypothetical protein ES708_34496 [subsurface metagenome]